MSDLSYPEPKDLSTKAFARAANAGIWMRRGADGMLGTTQDFSMALPCEDREQASDLWKKLCAETAAACAPKPAPQWSKSEPAIFMGVDRAAPPSSMSAFLAMCQGRFLSLKDTPGGPSYALTPNMGEAHIFSCQEDALYALQKAMPAADKRPQASILPLRACFGPPIQASPHGADPLASAMAAASARAPIAQAVDPGQAGARPARPARSL